MRQFECKVSFRSTYLDILEQLLTNYDYDVNTRLGETRELINTTITFNPHFKFNVGFSHIDYAYAETFFNWVLSGSTDMDVMIKANPRVAKFKNPYDDYNIYYGPRILESLPQVIELLKTDKDTRRAVVMILQNEDRRIWELPEGSAVEYPCLKSVHFMIRDNELVLIVNMRSNNAYTTICYDTYNFTHLHKHVYNALKETYPNLILGNYYHNVASMHLLARNMDDARKLMNP